MSFIKRVIKKAIRAFTGCKILYKTNWYKSIMKFILIMYGIESMMNETLMS